VTLNKLIFFIGWFILKGKKLPESEGGTTFSSSLEDEEVSDEDEAADMEDEQVHAHVVQTRGSTKNKQKLAKELSDCVVICQSAGFKTFEQSRQKSKLVFLCQ